MKSPVRKMFDGIALRYDFLNHFLSCGQDVLWRRACCRELRRLLKADAGHVGQDCAELDRDDGFGESGRADASRESGRADVDRAGRNRAGIRLLDLCGGTGDFAVTFEKFCGTPAKAILGDFSYGMLRGAEGKKTVARPVQLDAMKMPFADAAFDVILNGFGMRNLPDARGGLQESFRVLDRGGYLCVLEFFSPRNLFNKFFYKVLAPLFIPVMGAFFSGKREAYEYLVNSILHFLPVDEFCRLAEECGFEVKRVQMFDGGISFGVFLRKPSDAATGASKFDARFSTAGNFASEAVR